MSYITNNPIITTMRLIPLPNIATILKCKFCQWLNELGCHATLDGDGILTNATNEQLREVTRGYVFLIP